MRGLLLVLASIALVSAVCPQARTGLTLWSSRSAWNTAGANVNITAGTSVLVDQPILNKLGRIIVSGELIFANINMNFSIQSMLVTATGKLYIGSTEAGCAITSNIIITLNGNRTEASPIGSDPYDGVPFGDKGLIIATDSYVSIVGSVKGPTWTRLSQTVYNGTSTITVEDAIQWVVGDQIVIATTDFPETTLLRNLSSDINWLQGRGTPDQNEVRTITAVSGKTITLDAPLRYMHWGAGFEKAEVGLLNRKIVIQGDDSSDQSFFGGHVMIREVQYAVVQGVRFFRMGQRGTLGRYPLHFHLAYDAWDLGYLAKDNAFVAGFQRCITVHFTVGLTLDGNVAFNNTGHCFFLEDGAERGNTFNHNLGIQTRPISNSNPLTVLPTDNQPSIFWITNPNNTYTNNAAVGGRFGYWFSMPVQPTGPSAAFFPLNDLNVRPRNTPVAKFDGNVAHSCWRNGFHIDDGVVFSTDQNGLITQLSGYNPKQGPYDNGGTVVVAYFTNLIAYKNRQYGVWARGGLMVWDNITSLDNLRGFNTPPASSLLQNSLIVGETDNIGTPLPSEANRSRPNNYANNSPIKGWETYDNSGEQYAANVTFVNFTTNAIRIAGVFGPLECGPFLLQARDMIRNITFINANPVYINPCPGSTGDCPSNWVIFDTDGSVTGRPSWIVSNTSILVDETCTARSDWAGYSCPPDGTRPLQLFVNFIGAYNNSDPAFYNYTYAGRTAQKKMTVTPLGDDGSNRYEGFGSYLSGSTDFQMMANLKPRQGGYLISFNGSYPVYPYIRINVASALPRDWIFFALHYPAANLPLNITLTYRSVSYTLKPVSDITKLVSRFGYYYDTSKSLLYVRFDNADEGYRQNWGFTGVNGNDGAILYIRSATSYVVPAPIAIPPAIAFTASIEDEFQADVQQCQSVSNFVKNNASTIALFRLNPLNATLSYYVVHDQTKNGVTAGGLFQGAIGATGDLVQPFQYLDNPISWYFKLTRRTWVNLLKGLMYVSFRTSKATEAVRGQLSCLGSCRLPPAPPAIADRCAAVSTNDIIVYSDYPVNSSLTKFTSNYVYPGSKVAAYPLMYNTTAVFNDTTAPMCGRTSIVYNVFNGNFILQARGFWFLPAQYGYIQFYAKLGSGGSTNATSITVSINNGTSTFISYIATPQDIDNYYIDSFDWTRVRIPLASLNLQVNQTINYIQFTRPDSPAYAGQYVQYLIDEVRIVAKTADVNGTMDITQADVKTYAPQQVCNQIIASLPATSTSSGTGASSAGSTSGVVGSTSEAASGEISGSASSTSGVDNISTTRNVMSSAVALQISYVVIGLILAAAL